MVGVFLSAGLYFMRSSDIKLRVDIGRILDQDIVYLIDGSRIKCWVENEGVDEIAVETKEGAFTLPRSLCARIEKDVFLKFIHNAI
jgi:hypothetical protein